MTITIQYTANMNKTFFLWVILFFMAFSKIGYASRAAVTQPIPVDQIVGYDNFSPQVKQLISQALALTQKNLTYLYGSDNPNNGGLDCSGTISYLLKLNKITDAPRSSSEIYLWAVKQGKYYAVTAKNFNSEEFNHLRPGDLLFWKGTYQTNNNPPISHVMIYLGINKKKQPLMFGSSDGRYYQGKQMWGVSVFDFKLPDNKSFAQFIGYSCIPQLTCSSK